MRSGLALPRRNSAGVSTDLGLRPAIPVLPAGDPSASVRSGLSSLPLMWGHTYEIPELRLSFRLQFRISVAGLFRPEFPREISATRGGRDPGAGLCRDARGLGAAFVLFLPAYRAARGGSAPSRGPGRGGSRRSVPASANRHGGWRAAYGRRN